MSELPIDPHADETYTLTMPFTDGTTEEIEITAAQARDLAAGNPLPVSDETYSVDDGIIIRRRSAIAPREAGTRPIG